MFSCLVLPANYLEKPLRWVKARLVEEDEGEGAVVVVR